MITCVAGLDLKRGIDQRVHWQAHREVAYLQEDPRLLSQLALRAGDREARGPGGVAAGANHTAGICTWTHMFSRLM